jgi:hypothetical protein
VTTDVESARRDWESGYRRLLEAAGDAVAAEPLHRQVESVTDELRRRVGATFTLAELAAAYAGAEVWIRQALGDLPAVFPVSQLAVVEDAAFHLYSRGAIDYTP